MKRFCLLIFLFAALVVFSLSCNSSPQAVSTEVALAQPTATLPPTSTPEPTATPIPTSTPTETPVPTATPNRTTTAQAATMEAVVVTQYAEQTAAAAVAQQTEQAEAALWEKMVEEGSLTQTKGRLHTVDDFDESWAQRNWYSWWSFGYDLADFVLMTHIDWKSTQSDKTAFGGCGFVFRIKDNDNHLLVLVYVNGSAGLGQMTPYGYETITTGNPLLQTDSEKEGSADFVIVADKEIITAYINGEKAFRKLVARTNSGDMGYTILSGTNKDYGTNCKFSNTRIWELKK